MIEDLCSGLNCSRLDGLAIFVGVVVALARRFPMLRAWTTWAGFACALGALGQIARLIATPDVGAGIALLVSVAWAWAFLAEGARRSHRSGVQRPQR